MRLRRAPPRRRSRRKRVACVRDAVVRAWCLDGPKRRFWPGKILPEGDRRADQQPEAIAAPGDGTKVLLALFLV